MCRRTCVMVGQGVARDPARAYFHFDRAAKLGEVEALIGLALMLLDGSYYEPNCRVAHKALKLAAERGPWGQVVKEGYDAFAAGDEVGALLRYPGGRVQRWTSFHVGLSACEDMSAVAAWWVPPYRDLTVARLGPCCGTGWRPS